MRAPRLSALADKRTGNVLPHTFGVGWRQAAAWAQAVDAADPEVGARLEVVRLPRRLARAYRMGRWHAAQRWLAFEYLMHGACPERHMVVCPRCHGVGSNYNVLAASHMTCWRCRGDGMVEG